MRALPAMIAGFLLLPAPTAASEIDGALEAGREGTNSLQLAVTGLGQQALRAGEGTANNQLLSRSSMNRHLLLMAWAVTSTHPGHGSRRSHECETEVSFAVRQIL